jgi:hypothetical protein
MDLPDQQALAWTNLGWLWYYTGQIEEAYEALQQATSSIPRGYVLPPQGTLPPMGEGRRRGEACLPFWSTLGKAEMLRAYISLDQAQVAPSPEEQGERLKEAVRFITLSLAYDEQIADEHFDMTRAEAGLHRRIVQDRLSIASLHQRAQQVAEEQHLQRPTRFQRFLERMFGSADLWA